MNIGIFTDMYHPQISGVVTSARILEKELNKLGHKVYIFTTSDPGATHPSPRVFRLPSVPFIFLRETHRMVFFYPPRLIRKVKKCKLDVVHTYTEFSLGFFGRFQLIAERNLIPFANQPWDIRIKRVVRNAAHRSF